MTRPLLIVGREGLAEFLGGSLDLAKKLRAQPGFPAPLAGKGRICWSAAEVEAWLESAPRRDAQFLESKAHRTATPVKHRRSKNDRPLRSVG